MKIQKFIQKMSKEQRKRWGYILVISGVFAFSLVDREMHAMDSRALGSEGILFASSEDEALRIKELMEHAPAPEEIELYHFGKKDLDIPYYPDPEYSAYEKTFCRGYKNPESCDKTAKHPIFESDKYYGVRLPEVEAERKFTYEIK